LLGNAVHLANTLGQRFLDPFQLLFVVRRAIALVRKFENLAGNRVNNPAAVLRTSISFAPWRAVSSFPCSSSGW
jgi:hypothetical protein